MAYDSECFGSVTDCMYQTARKRKMNGDAMTEPAKRSRFACAPTIPEEKGMRLRLDIQMSPISSFDIPVVSPSSAIKPTTDLDDVILAHQEMTSAETCEFLRSFKHAHTPKHMRDLLNAPRGFPALTFASHVLHKAVDTREAPAKRRLSVQLLDMALELGAQFSLVPQLGVNGSQAALAYCLFDANSDNLDIAEVIHKHDSRVLFDTSYAPFYLLARAVWKERSSWIKWIGEKATAASEELNKFVERKEGDSAPVTMTVFRMLFFCSKPLSRDILTQLLVLPQFHIRCNGEINFIQKEHPELLHCVANNAQTLFCSYIRNLPVSKVPALGDIIYKKDAPRYPDAVYAAIITSLSAVQHRKNAEEKWQIIQQVIQRSPSEEKKRPAPLQRAQISSATPPITVDQYGIVCADHVSRSSPYVDLLANCDKRWLYRPPNISFEGEKGEGPGVFWDWCYIYLKWCFDRPDICERLQSEDGAVFYTFNPTQQQLGYYTLMGRVMGWLFTYGLRASHRLTRYLYDQLFLVTETDKLLEQYYEEIKPTQYIWFIQPLQNRPLTEVAKSLMREEPWEHNDGTLVTEETKLQFAREVMMAEVHKAPMQMIAFRDGFWDIFDHYALANARIHDKTALLYGPPSSIITATEFIAICGFSSQLQGLNLPKYTQMFKDAVAQLSPAQSSALYTFITAMASRPQMHITERISVVFVDNPKLLPFARTCFCQLWVPTYENVSEMTRKLLTVIDFCSNSTFEIV